MTILHVSIADDNNEQYVDSRGKQVTQPLVDIKALQQANKVSLDKEWRNYIMTT